MALKRHPKVPHRISSVNESTGEGILHEPITSKEWAAITLAGAAILLFAV
jgi:hypothetical protein